MGEVDKLLSEFGKAEKIVKKAVADLKKKPGDKKLTDLIKTKMIEMKGMQKRFAKAAADDQKYMDGVMNDIAP